jgi:ribosomal protein S18 acetylase RimI-like enzyme
LSVRIRPASHDDAEAIARVHVQAWHETYRGMVPDGLIAEQTVAGRTERWRAILAEAPIVRVAEDDGMIVGFGSAGRRMSQALGTDGEITALYLLDSIKRRGVGRALLTELFAALAAGGFVSVGLWVAVENAAARRFYEVLGGRAAHTREDKRGEYVLQQIAYTWDDVGRFGR